MLRKLSYDFAQLDYDAFTSSPELIRKIRGGNWPEESITLKDDMIDLAWHQREFEYKLSFAYCVFDKSEEYIGCVYFYPPNMPWLSPPEGTDVVVNLWVIQKA